MAPPATWRIPTTFAIVAVIAIAGMAKLAAPNPAGSATAPLPPVAGAPAPQAMPSQAAFASSGTVSALRSRFVGRTTVEVWGRTTAPDGAAVRMRVRAAGVPSIGVPEVPAVAGRFYAKVALSPQLHGRAVHISARIVP
jgi:hypothetical protein